jgi:phage terminase Nu1 subunit (DNA packaging protein)
VEKVKEMSKSPSVQSQKIICDYLNAKPELSRVTSEVANDIARMIDDARSSALEEAAKVADARARVSRLADKPSQLIHVSMTLAQFEAEAIATAIRALKEGAKP